MVDVVFGTAQLYGMASEDASELLLEEAHRVGIRRIDTAPSYGRGSSEARVGAFLVRHPDVTTVTTKVGIEASEASHGARRAAAVVARRLPAGTRARLRGAANRSTQGQFDAATVASSIDRSLARLGRIDRLLLHEVHAEQVTDELLAVLVRRRQAGDVVELGVATENEFALAALARGPDVFSVAHINVGPLHMPVVLPPLVTIRVGHGLLGNGGEHARALAAVATADTAAAAAWREATDGSRWAAKAGLAHALLARATGLDVDEVIVATTRPVNVALAAELVGGSAPMPTEVAAALHGLIAAVSGQAVQPRRS